MKKEINAAELKRKIQDLRKQLGKSQRPYDCGAQSACDSIIGIIRDMQLGVIEKGN